MSASDTSRPRGASLFSLVAIAALAVTLAALTVPWILAATAAGAVERSSALQRGRAAFAIVAPSFVRQALLDDLKAAPDASRAIRDGAAIIALEGVLTAPPNGGTTAVTAPTVMVYGVDERTWTFFGIRDIPAPTGDQVLMGARLAARLGLAAGRAVSVIVPDAGDISPGTLDGRRNRAGRVIEGHLVTTPSFGDLSPFAPASPPTAGQDSMSDAIYLPLARLQDGAAWHERVNVILVASAADDAAAQQAALDRVLADAVTADDLGVSVVDDPSSKTIIVNSRTGAMDDAVVDAVSRAAIDTGGLPTPVLTTLVRAIRHGEREVPYSFVSSLELQAVAPDVHAEELSRAPIVLNASTAARLGVTAGETVQVEYYVQRANGGIERESGEFEVAGVLPMSGLALQPGLTPPLPGITGAPSMAAWVPFVPFESGRITTADEDYWSRHGPTPKAFVPAQVGRALWRTSAMAATAVQMAPADGMTLADAHAQLDLKLRSRLSPAMTGLHVRPLALDAAARANAAASVMRPLTWWLLPLAGAALLLFVAAAQRARWTVIASLPPAVISQAAVFVAVISVGLGGWLMAGHTSPPASGRGSMAGGYELFARTTLPVIDLTPIVRGGPGISAFRVETAMSPDSHITAGPADVRVAAVNAAFIDEGRFAFTASLDRTDEERANPWLLLRREQRDASDPGAAEPPSPIIPAIATPGMLAQLQARLGQDIAMAVDGRRMRLRIVAVSSGRIGDGVFDEALYVNESDFSRWFANTAGFRWLAAGSAGSAENTENRAASGVSSAGTLSERLSTFGVRHALVSASTSTPGPADTMRPRIISLCATLALALAVLYILRTQSH